MSLASVVKVGGSLFDLEGLGPRLRRWLEDLRARPVLLVPGGGAAADVVREWDRGHGLGEEAAHWLALRALGLNARFLAALLGGQAEVVEELGQCAGVWEQGKAAVLDPHAFARADEGRAGCLPHSWSVTSDSVAARAAVVLGCRRLVLLKSTELPQGINWAEAGRRGLVDAYLATMVAANDLEVVFVNFRKDSGGVSGG